MFRISIIFFLFLMLPCSLIAMDSSELSDQAWLSTHSARVIIAEDEDSCRKIIIHSLNAVGMEVDVCANGCELLQKYSPNTHHVVIMDGNMPEKDGYDTTRDLCRLYPSVYVIASTANTSEADKKRFMDAGAKAFVPKPVNLKQLWSALRLALSSQEIRPPAP